MSALNAPILVLDKNYQPCKICPARDILPLVCVDKAKILDRDFQIHDLENWIIYSELYIQETGDMDNIVVRSPSIRLLVPEVIILTDYIRNPNKDKKVRFSRQSVFKRDSYTCQYCAKKLSRKDLTIDHVVPRSRGGLTNFKNIVAACFKCNTKKANRTPEEAQMPLRTKPTIPNWRNEMESLRGKNPLWEKLL